MKNYILLMQRAIELARKCEASRTAFSVGAILMNAEGLVVGEGYSRQLGDSTHAEQNAIHQALQAGHSLVDGTVITTMEPCQKRLSGKKTCTQAILDAGIKKVVFAQREPTTFVQHEGIAGLTKLGLEVIELTELADAAARVNSHLSSDLINIVFDWSGTLSDDLSLVYRATMEVLKAYNVDEISYQDFKRDYKIPYMGFYAKYAPQVDREHARQIFEAAIARINYPDVYPDALEVVRECHRRGHKLAVFSGLPQDRLEEEAMHYGIAALFQVIRGSVYDKSQVIESFLQEIGFAPNKTLMVADMVHDIEAARTAGIKIAALTWGYDDANRIVQAKPDYILEDIKKLVTVTTFLKK